MADRPQGLPEEAQEIPSAGFNNYVGPFYRLPDVDGGAVRRFAFAVAEKHMNAAGTIHGGMLMSFVDMAMGRRRAPRRVRPVAAPFHSIVISWVPAVFMMSSKRACGSRAAPAP